MFQPLNITPPKKVHSLHSVVNDNRAIAHLIDQLLAASGFTNAELARRLGVVPQTLAQYRYGRRTHPSVQWVAKLVEVCGGKLYIELPSEPLGNEELK